jgi:hypothetical protein
VKSACDEILNQISSRISTKIYHPLKQGRTGHFGYAATAARLFFVNARLFFKNAWHFKDILREFEPFLKNEGFF